MEKLLYINACIRNEISRTKYISSKLIEKLSKKYAVEEIDLCVTSLEAITTPLHERRSAGEHQPFALEYANMFAKADRIVVAFPFWDMSFPSVFKVFCENISINGVTFIDGEDGNTRGVCKAKKMLLITTRGMEIEDESPLDQASSYLKALCFLWGIPEFEVVSAIGMDVCNDVTRQARIEEAIHKGLKICEDF